MQIVLFGASPLLLALGREGLPWCAGIISLCCCA
jgi:hypothetical protein